MTALRKSMLACLQRRGLSARTQAMSVRAGRQRAEPSHTSPALITEEELRPSFLYLTHVKPYSRRASTIALGGLTFCFAHTLTRAWTTLTCVRPPREKQLPVILSREEVHRMLSCVRRLRYRLCLTTLDSCGLRLQEGTRLQGPDIDSARRLSQVRHGQGGKAREVPLPHRTLALLRR
jgi:integrase/recombinase XerD